jgi:hypothetical protein
MLLRTDRCLIIVHQLSYYQAPMGLANKVWHQKLFVFTGNVTGSQMPHTINWVTQALQILPHPVRVSKITKQVAAIMHNIVENLPPVAVGLALGTYDNIQTRYAMYVPGKYLPLLLAHHLTPKEAFLTINAVEAVAENEQILLGPLITWLCVAIAQSAVKDESAVKDASPSMVAGMLPSTLPIMEADFVKKQRVMAERDFPTWNCTNVMGGGPLGGTLM